MALNDQLKRYLEQERAAYETLPHRQVGSRPSRRIRPSSPPPATRRRDS